MTEDPTRCRSNGAQSDRRAASTASTIHRALRAEILTLVRPPGAPVVEAEIARAFDCSRTPAREALLRLADEGLIAIFPQSGTFVASIPVAELPEAILLRSAIEEAVAREAARRVTESGLAGLRAQLARQRALDLAGDHEAFHLADEQFHATIAAIADRNLFWQTVQQTKLQVDRFRRLTLPRAGRMGTVVGEHVAIVDALARADPDGAAAAIADHLAGLLASLEAARTTHPDWFAPVTPPPQRVR